MFPRWQQSHLESDPGHGPELNLVAAQGAAVDGPRFGVDEPEEEGEQGGQREERVHHPSRAVWVGRQPAQAKAPVHKRAKVRAVRQEDYVGTWVGTCKWIG